MLTDVDRSEIAMIAVVINDAIALAVALGVHLTSVQVEALGGFALSLTTLAFAYLLHRKDKAA